MLKRFIDSRYEKSEAENYGKQTVVCNSWEDFDNATKNIDCGLVSPGGCGISRLEVKRLEKEGKIRVFRVWVNDNFLKYEPIFLRFFYPSREQFVYIPWDDVEGLRGKR